MFWADRIAKEIVDTRKPSDGKTFLIRDEKTISGRVHVGSMRGVAIHGLVAEVLSEMGVPNQYQYELNDFDPFDSLPYYLDADVYTEHLGKPLYTVPSPEPGFANYAEYFGAEYVNVHKKAGFTPTYYRATELYQSGKMDPYIKMSLDKAADIRRILKEVSNSVKKDEWLPVSVVCEKCGKMMTTRSLSYDAEKETVSYICDIGPDGTVPCGYEGSVSPYGGRTKLFWKTDWAAKWCAMNVDIEGAGKDHYTKGGSHDVAAAISREIFNREAPFDIPYEFFLVGGKKMSSSKGSGSTAHDMSELFPATVFRLALIGKDINQQVEVDPAGDSVPRLYDWHDELAENVRNGVTDDFSRLYELTYPVEERAGEDAPWMLRFSQVAFIAQMPHINLLEEAESQKGGALTEEEKALLEERKQYALFWLNTYATDEHKFVLQETVPTTISLTPEQKTALGLLSEYMTEQRSGEDIHAVLHGLKTEVPIAPKDLFTAVYNVFLNRDSGPKAGWFLSVLPHEYVHKMLFDASR
jgi:lysyl-tRNA synthetase class 1